MISRPHQDTPEDLIATLLDFIRGQFCGDLTPKQWAQSQPFLRRNVVLWPARFMAGKGFTIPAASYRQIMLGIFQEVIRHGHPGAIKYWPGYLMKCVQEHWRHHWEDYYAEAKSAQAITERAIFACKSVPQAPDRTVEILVAAHAVLTNARKTRQNPRPRAQLDLFPEP